MTRNDKDCEELIKACEKDIYTEVDGFYVFGTSKGCLYSYQLRWIADELDRRNEDWNTAINNLSELLGEDVSVTFD